MRIVGTALNFGNKKSRRGLQNGAMTRRSIDIVWDRLDELNRDFYLAGVDLDPRPGTSLVEPHYYAEPVTGLVQVHAQIADVAIPLGVRITELWRDDYEGAHETRGFSIHAYTYKAIWLTEPRLTVHYDRDPEGHPDEITHWHPPFVETPAGLRRRERRECEAVPAGRAVSAAFQLAADVERLQSRGIKSPVDTVEILDIADYKPYPGDSFQLES